jgi:hypothetical protein
MGDAAERIEAPQCPFNALGDTYPRGAIKKPLKGASKGFTGLLSY